jgi:hypothetical protein
LSDNDEGRPGEIRGDLLFVMGCAVLAALLGTAHNLVDSRISPEFYRIVKGVGNSATVPLSAAFIGASRGAVLGVFGAVVITMTASEIAQARWRAVTVALSFALLGSTLAGASAALWDLPILRASAERHPAVIGLDEATRQRLDIVSAMHSGLYSGGAIGLLEACRRARRRSQRDVDR